MSPIQTLPLNFIASVITWIEGSVLRMIIALVRCCCRYSTHSYFS